MCNFDENSTLYPVWYAFAVAFHPSLNIDRKFVVRGFRHTFKQLNNFQFVPAEMLPYFDPITVRQLRNCTQTVYAKKERFSSSEIFSCEIKLVIDSLKKWLAEKYFKCYNQLDSITKQNVKRENPIDWNIDAIRSLILLSNKNLKGKI